MGSQCAKQYTQVMHMELCGNMPNISWEGVGREDYQGRLQGRDVVGAESKRLN